MNCSAHGAVPAVASCGACGRGLCGACADDYEPPTCAGCAAKAARGERAILKRQLAMSVVLLAAGAAFGQTAAATPGVQPPSPTWLAIVGMAYLFAGTPYGWRSLSSGTSRLSRLFLRLPVMGRVFYFAYKLSASAMVGAVVMPFKVWAAVRTLRAAP